MKIKTVAALCKAQSKTATIFQKLDSNGYLSEQYIGVGQGIALYPANDLPELDEKLLLTIFDVPIKDRKKWHVTIKPFPEIYDTESFTKDEVGLQDTTLSLIYRGVVMRTLYTRDQVWFINPDLLKPTDDVRDLRELTFRGFPKNPYIVVKNGFIIQGFIMPLKVVGDEFFEALDKLNRRCRAMEDWMLGNKSEPEKFTNKDIPGQQDFDPETGEILEEDDSEANGVIPMKTHEERNKEFIRGIIGDKLQDEPAEG